MCHHQRWSQYSSYACQGHGSPHPTPRLVPDSLHPDPLPLDLANPYLLPFSALHPILIAVQLQYPFPLLLIAGRRVVCFALRAASDGMLAWPLRNCGRRRKGEEGSMECRRRLQFLPRRAQVVVVLCLCEGAGASASADTLAMRKWRVGH
jgi:hypothetical protein